MNYKPIGGLASLCALIFGTGTLLRAVPADLAPLRTIYDAHLAQFESEYSTEAEAWKLDYRNEVAKLAQTSQRAGNLEGWQAASAEATRFDAERSIPEASSPETPEAVKTLHARFRTSDAQCVQRRFRKVAELTTKYLARLEALKAEATRAGKFDDAIGYNAEIKRVQELPAVIRAREATAAVPTSVPPSAEPAAAPASVETPATARPSEPEQETPNGVVLSEGLTPPVVPGMTFKPVTLSITDRMRVARRLSVQAELCSISEMERTSYSRSGSTHHVLRLGLRPTSSAQSIEGARLVVEFYGKNVRERAARIIPKPMGALKTDLPRLDGSRWVFVRLPRVSAESTSYRSSYYYSGYHYGLEYYGAVISVFDAADGLIYQAVSAANLMALAPDKMPELPAPDQNPLPEVVPLAPDGVPIE